MRKFKIGKLVRDKIAKHMIDEKQIPNGVKTLNDEEYQQKLIQKIAEEAQELLKCNTEQELREEVADLQEVLDYLKSTLGITEEELRNDKQKKAAKNGGFDDRVYIESVSLSEDNPWFEYYSSKPNKYPEIIFQKPSKK